MSGQDSVWKEILDACLEEFMEFFFPHIHRDIDWARGYECLDQELEPILREGPFRERRVDTLVKVFLLDGSETWILVHIEVQGYTSRSACTSAITGSTSATERKS